FAREIEVYARAVCGDDTDPLLFDQANIIAECQVVFRCLRAERVGLIERLQDPTAIPIVKGDNARALAKARSEQSRLAFDEYMRLLDNLYGALPQEHRHRNYDDLMQHLYLHCPDKLMEEYHGPKWPVADEPPQERDEFTALRMAMPDLDRLIPYQRRAKSRLKR